MMSACGTQYPSGYDWIVKSEVWYYYYLYYSVLFISSYRCFINGESYYIWWKPFTLEHWMENSCRIPVIVTFANACYKE